MTEPVWIPYQAAGRNPFGEGIHKLAMSITTPSTPTLHVSPPAMHELDLHRDKRFIFWFSPATGHIAISAAHDKSPYRPMKLTVQRSGIGRAGIAAAIKRFGIDIRKLARYIELTPGTIQNHPALTARLVDWKQEV